MTRQQRFLASEIEALAPDQCLFHVIPAPYEASVSYGHGTALGPQTILDASFQLELWTGRAAPGKRGIYTWPAVDCSGSPEAVLERVEAAVARVFEQGVGPLPPLPVILGGEHTLTLGTLRALQKRHGRFGILHFDAHADLRQEYEGSQYSHACVMRRATQDLGLDLFQVGVRSLSEDEDEYRKARKIHHLDARELAWNPSLANTAALPLAFPHKVFLSFDIDALDASLMPATGTPEPGGLLWWPALNLVEKFLHGKEVLGFDLVEFAPIPQLHAPDYTAARLCYELMGLCLEVMEKEAGL